MTRVTKCNATGGNGVTLRPSGNDCRRTGLRWLISLLLHCYAVSLHFDSKKRPGKRQVEVEGVGNVASHVTA